jgi:hypothetical protein
MPRKSILLGTTNEAHDVTAGDVAFPWKTYLMRPYQGKLLNNIAKRIYNYRFCSARKFIW